MKNSFAAWLDTFVEEKGIDLEETFEFTDKMGQYNLMPYAVVIEAAKKASAVEQETVKKTIVAIDFKNGDVKHYLRFLGEAMANTALSR